MPKFKTQLIIGVKSFLLCPTR